NTLNPTAKMQQSGLSHNTIMAMTALLEGLLVDPISVCKTDSGTVERNVVIKDSFVRNANGKLMMEDIPEADLAICYDKDSNAFTCHSVRDVAYSILRGDGLNPHTNKPYPVDFVERI